MRSRRLGEDSCADTLGALSCVPTLWARTSGYSVKAARTRVPTLYVASRTVGGGGGSTER